MQICFHKLLFYNFLGSDLLFFFYYRCCWLLFYHCDFLFRDFFIFQLFDFLFNISFCAGPFRFYMRGWLNRFFYCRYIFNDNRFFNGVFHRWLSSYLLFLNQLFF